MSSCASKLGQTIGSFVKPKPKRAMTEEPSLEELEHVYAVVVNVCFTIALSALIALGLMLL